MKSQKKGERNERMQLGRRGEELATQFLMDKGYQIRHRNWRHSYKEVDIIAQWKDQIIFVEVRTRKSKFANQGPEATIGKRKQLFLVEAAKAYLEHHNLDFELRFDVIAILMPDSQRFKVNHIEDAFFPGLG